MIDNILVYGKDTREHDERLQQVMKRIRDAGMTLNKKKCQYRVEELIFLGHKISAKVYQTTQKYKGNEGTYKKDGVEKLFRNLSIYINLVPDWQK